MDLKSEVVYFPNISNKMEIASVLSFENQIISLTEIQNGQIIFSVPLKDIESYSSDGYTLCICLKNNTYDLSFSKKNNKKLSWAFYFPAIFSVIMNALLFTSMEKTDLPEWLILLKDNKIHQGWRSRIIGLPLLIILVMFLAFLLIFEQRMK